MTMQTTFTKETIQAALEAKILSGLGARIEISEEALKQAQGLMDLAKSVSHYDESKLTENDLEMLAAIVDNFTTEWITGEVVNGVLEPITDDEYTAALEAVGTIDLASLALAVMLIELTTKHKHFYR